MKNLNTALLIAVVLYAATTSFGANLSCLPGSQCSKQKRSVNCPPCIPFNEKEYFKSTCPDRPYCVKSKRSTKSEECPPCIPIYQLDYYQASCPSTSICTKQKRSPKCDPGCIPDKGGVCYCDGKTGAGRQDRSVDDCPPCIPYNERKYHKYRCPDKPYCAKSKRSTKSEECPPCIPIHQLKYYQLSCPSTSICTKQKRSTDCGSGCLPINGKCICARNKRSVSCPVCMPLNEVAIYQNDCASTPICNKRIRRELPCPPCIPVEQVHIYMHCVYTRLCINAKSKQTE